MNFFKRFTAKTNAATAEPRPVPMRQLADDIYVSGQIRTEDIPGLVQNGIASIICNRPDGESPGQSDFAAIKAAAEQAGMVVRYIPIVPGRAGQKEVDDFAQAMRELKGPVLAYCRSGQRSSAMWSYSRQQ